MRGIHDELFEDEDPALRQQAGHQGWTVDEDGWLRRLRRPGDIESKPLGFMSDTHVYVPSCASAVEYDRRMAEREAS